MINGKKVRDLRKSRGWTQKELSDGLCSVSMISQIETGKATPSEYLVKLIASKLEVDVDDLKYI